MNNHYQQLKAKTRKELETLYIKLSDDIFFEGTNWATEELIEAILDRVIGDEVLEVELFGSPVIPNEPPTTSFKDAQQQLMQAEADLYQLKTRMPEIKDRLLRLAISLSPGMDF